MKNKEIAERLHDKLLLKFEDPYYGLEDMVEDNAIFNYANYYDSGHFAEEVEEETEYLISQKDWLKEQGYKGFMYIGNYILEL